MKRFLGVLLLALMLPACSTLNTIASGKTKNITPRQVYQLEASYVIVRQGLAVYRRLPWCSDTVPAPCQTVAVATQIKRADKIATDALTSLDAFSRAHDTLNIAAAYDAAQRAVAAARAIATAYAPKEI